MQSIIAVSDVYNAACGAISYWRLSGSVQLTKLAFEWVAAGLSEDLLPAEPSASVALRRALASLEERRRLVRPMGERGHWAIVDEHITPDGTLDYVISASVKLSSVSAGSVLEINHDGGMASCALAVEIRDAFERHKYAITQTDVSSWLVFLASRAKGVALRDTGGIYFIPRDELYWWGQVTMALQAASEHRVFEIPALRSDEAVNAILDAVTREAEEACNDLEKELFEGEMQKRALVNRSQRAEGMQAKLKLYEGLLGKHLEQQKARLNKIQADLAAAALMASMQDD